MAGEADIIQGTFAPLAAGFPGAFGLKDDAAAVTPPPGHELAVTVDAIAAGVHFFANDAADGIGWKALAVNVSDLIAKGAAPHAYVMSIAFPEVPPADWLAGFGRGLKAAQEAFGLALAGGDTDRRPGPLSITITALGFVPAGQFVRRGVARPGDHLFVSGTIGDSALGLAIRQAEEGLAARWPLPEAALHGEVRAALVSRYLRPQPPLALIPALRTYARAAMDLSDGPVKDLQRMAEASGVGAMLDLCRLPLSDAARQVLAAEPETIGAIATGGDDYQVLAAVAPERRDGFVQAALTAGVAVTEAGRITDGREVRIAGPGGTPVTFARPGYDHF